ncbi:Proline-rich protein [Actinidia chinensis var. chinensis]|uniref:Proline-rich protein n=1 Tax=Actinidia chinensis var. chinensis TaxID=1590841 RepID=A0A2R6PZK0_ACTCC|nr:Proline-rich protein [Actinidia chinensis var. chinensis]
MGVSDVVAGNLTTLYLVVIAAMKAHGLATGQGFSGGFVLLVSTAVVGVVLIVSVIWDVSRKAAKALTRDRDRDSDRDRGAGVAETCRGGICWHGVAVRSPASQLRLRLPQHHPHHFL